MLGFMDKRRAKNENPTIHDLYPHLNEAQLKEAEENLNRYLEIVLRIYDRIEKDLGAYTRFKVLTASNGGTMIDLTRSNPT